MKMHRTTTVIMTTAEYGRARDSILRNGITSTIISRRALTPNYHPD